MNEKTVKTNITTLADLQVAQRPVLIKAALDLLAARIKRDGKPLNHQTLIENLAVLPVVVDAAFPQYQTNKLLSVLADCAQRGIQR